MAIIDDFLKECVEKVDNHDVVVLVGFTKEQTDYIREYLKPKYNWVDYRGVTTYKKLSEVVNGNLINILFELKQGKKILLSYEELLLLAPQLNFVKDKNFLILKNPLNIVLPLEYSQSLLSDLYSKSIDLSDSDDEEVTAVFQFYNVVPIETKNGFLLFHGECRDLGEIISTLQSVEIFPQVIGMEPPIVQRKISEIKNSKILVMDLSGQGIFSEHIFQPHEIHRFISSIYTGMEIFFLNGENWPGLADFAGFLSNYDITVKKLEIPVSKEYQYAKNYKDKVHAILRKHWGKDATFRIYSMYRDDRRDGSLTEVSQEDVVYEIIEQVCAAKNNEQYRDIFFVASTGAGKSLLYQLPSKIFHDENMVTVVVTPLKSLMTDQYQDARDKGLRHVVYINSDVPYAERQVRLEGVKQGTYSLLYISPEFLQRVYDIHQIVGDREIALFVVDEAHCVSSWGKDFRADYGYLGRYIARYKNRDGRFPILALTATAVYGGSLDTIAEISMDLKMQNPIIYMTDVKRQNISINIQKFQFSAGKYAKNKHQIALSRVNQFLEDNRKFIVYSPYRTTSNNLFIDIDAKKRERVRVYTGETTYEEGLAIINDFKSGAVRGVIATKAFGMGVDIRDIEVVYHYAIPANLADYVQEIGRAGRDKTVNAEAICDFNPKDFGYWRTLRILSRLKQWQIKLLVRKIYEKYKQDGKHTLLLPLEWFQFLELSDTRDYEANRIRQALMLIEKDFYQRYKFPILRVYPGEENAVYFARIDEENQKLIERFLKQYAQYVEPLEGQVRNIVRFNLKEYYEKEFSDEVYGAIKRKFFNGNLFKDVRLVPRIRLTMELCTDYRRAIDAFQKEMTNIVKLYESLDRQTSRDEIKDAIRKTFKMTGKAEEVEKLTYLLTTLFSSERIEPNPFILFSCKIDPELEQYVYVKTNRTPEVFVRSFLNSFESTFCNQNYYEGYLEPVYCCKSNITQNKLQLAYLLELMGIATYSIAGGQHETIKIRLLSPEHLKATNYRNHMLDQLYKRDETEYKVLQSMIERCSSSEQYWHYIEQYFLGRVLDENS